MAVTLLVIISVDGHPPYGHEHGHEHWHEHGHEHGHGCGHGEGGGLLNWMKGKLGIGRTTSRPLTTPTTIKMPTSVTTSTTTISTVSTDSGDQQPDVVEDGNEQRQDSDKPIQGGDTLSQDGDRPNQNGSPIDGDIFSIVDTSSENVDDVRPGDGVAESVSDSVSLVDNVPTNGSEPDAMLIDEGTIDPLLDLRSPLQSK